MIGWKRKMAKRDNRLCKQISHDFKILNMNACYIGIVCLIRNTNILLDIIWDNVTHFDFQFNLTLIQFI